jgi:hypothetical protein
MVFKYNPNSLSICFLILHVKSAKEILGERQKDGADPSNDGFYESKTEWMRRRYYILAFEGYVLYDDSWLFRRAMCSALYIIHTWRDERLVRIWTFIIK